MPGVIEELRRRNVFRVGVAYVVVAWVIAQVAELALDSFAAPDWVIKTLLLLLVLGLPLALFFAWAFELTPEGIKKEKDVERSQSITRHTAHKLDRAIIIVLAVALGYFVVDKFLIGGDEATSPVQAGGAASAMDGAGSISTTEPDGKVDEKSIAVLPFVDMSPEKNQEYFSDGIAEELLNVLVKIKGIKVASRTSSFSFKGKEVAIPEIARELKVNNILEGSVRKAGDRVRITAQLIDVRTDRHLWSETYDRKLEDVFAVQDEIAKKIVGALQVALGGGERAALESAHQPTENLDAYELYLRGRALWQRRGEENIKRSIALFEQATGLDPDFARAWSALAAAHLTLPSYSPSADRQHEWQEAEALASKALTLDPNLAEALAVMGDVTRNKGQWQGAEEYYRKAIALEPGSVTGPLWYAEFLMDVGRVHDALAQNQRAMELDPLSPGANANVSAIYNALGDYQNALKYARVAADLGHAMGILEEAYAELDLGNYARAREAFDRFAKAADLPPKATVDFGLFVDAVENPDRVPQLLETLDQPPGEGPEQFNVVNFVRFGELDKAFASIPRKRESWANENWYLWDANLSPLRRDPRFKELMHDSGLVPYWRNNTWSDYCHPQGDDFYCE